MTGGGMPPEPKVLYSFGVYVLDPQRRELRLNATVVPVEPQVFDLLELLIRNRERVVSKDDLIDEIWGGQARSDSVVSSRIRDARRAIGDNGKRQQFIRTLHRKGFRFVGEVELKQVRAANSPTESTEAGQGWVTASVAGGGATTAPDTPERHSIAARRLPAMPALLIGRK